MSTFFSETNSLPSRRPWQPVHLPQSSSWLGWSALAHALLRWNERGRQRAALRDLAEDLHLLDDLGLTRQQAIDEANKPFWQ
jgi:uncharacterized protein YjiS (DUF1127 family)